MFSLSSPNGVAGILLSSTAGPQLIASRIPIRAIAAIASAIALASCSTSPSSDLDRVGRSAEGVMTPNPQFASAADSSYAEDIIPVPRGSFDVVEPKEADYLTSRLRDLPWD